MKIIEVIADSGHVDTLRGLAEQYDISDYWFGAVDEDGRCSVRLLVDNENRQMVLDSLQSILMASENASILVLPVEAVLSKEPAGDNAQEDKRSSVALTREELYNDIEKNARLDSTYLLLVALSTIVAAIGLLEDNVTVVIAAMVIAPLLGPNIAFAFSTSLGDRRLMWRSLKTNLAGISVAFVICVIIGYFWLWGLESSELMSRTRVGLDSVVLALASGAAAVLSLITGVASALVGVMVAVALLPPTATLGIMLGSGEFTLAAGAGLLLAVNIVCLNLAAKLAFLSKGIKPRTWLEQQKARQSMGIYISIWLVLLGILIAVIVL